MSLLKGWLGEKIATFGMWALLDSRVYHRIDNAIIPSPNGTTQIDHILISVFGIFVIETKHIKGWIFGSADSEKWTQSIFGKKSQFQNPLKQNYRHTKCLAEYHHLDHAVFKSVVFFAAECEFKTEMPPNVMNGGLITYIKEFQQPCLSSQQTADALDKLLELKKDPSLTKASHLESLRERHESATDCPKCGSPLVARTARKGPLSGQSFLGCSAYPKCSYTKNL